VLAIEDHEVVSAIRFVRENCHRPFRISDILSHVPVGRRALERRVRQALGHSLGDEILQARLIRAKKLLTSTDWSIAKVAQQCGFNDFRYLSVVFRRATGQSPSEYRAERKSG
jgi:LacI family transcriptional regulator